jgi:hypothetical protein
LLFQRPPAKSKFLAASSGSDPVSGLVWHSDGQMAYAVAPGGGYNAQIYVVSADGKRRRVTGDGPQNNFSGDFARDGRYLFRSNVRDPASTDTRMFEPAKGESHMALQVEGLGGVSDLIDNSALVSRLVTRGDNNLWLVDLASGKRVLLTPHVGRASVAGEFGPDPRTVYVLSGRLDAARPLPGHRRIHRKQVSARQRKRRGQGRESGIRAQRRARLHLGGDALCRCGQEEQRRHLAG